MKAAVYDMLIIGGGPGGYTAALYAARAGLSTLVLEKLSVGGQMTQTEAIDAKIRRLINGYDSSGDRYNGNSVWKSRYTGTKIFQVDDFPSDEQVLSVVRDMVRNGKEITMMVKKGDKVICSKYSGTEIKLDGEEYKFVKQDDILAVVVD